MPDEARSELAELRDRATQLALDKAHLELLVSLMSGLGRAMGLDQTVDSLVHQPMLVLGGTNACLWYLLDDVWHYAEALGERSVVETITDQAVLDAIATRRPVELRHGVADTQMRGPEFGSAATWILPLAVGDELVGVLRIENLHISMHEFGASLPVFYGYAAALLNGERRSHSRLLRAHNALKDANQHLEQRVAERTGELQATAAALGQELLERARAEAALRASEERFRTIANYALDWESWISPQGKLLWVSPSVQEFTGYTDAECGQMVDFPLALVYEDDRAAVSDLFGLAVSGGTANDREFRVQHRDGRVRWVSVSFRPICDDAGRSLGHRSCIRNIDARKRAEVALRQAEEQFRLLVEVAPYGIHLHARGRFVYLNPAALQLFGAPNQEALVGRPVVDFVPAELRAVVADRIRLVYEERTEAAPMAQRYIRLDGTVVDVHVAMSPFEVDGMPGALAIAHDVTEQRRLEEQLRHAQRLEAIGRLAGGVAHDLNNLLTPILGYTEMLAEGFDEGDPRAEDLDHVRHAALRARDLTRQLLAFGRRQVMSLGPVDLNEVLRCFYPLLRRTLHESIQFEVRLPAEPLVVRADVGQLEQVLMNLVVNAQDAMPKGGRLSIKARAAPGQAELLVADTGCGMDAATAARVFEPFYTSKATGKGTGLGLATAHGIVQQHGGELTMESRLGCGTTFTIRLPQVDEAPGPVTTERLPRAKKEPVTEGQHTVVAIVDDDRGVRDLAERAMRLAGHIVVTASSGDELMRCLASAHLRIALLVTDVVMPGMTGKELYEQMALRQPQLPVLYISGYDDEVISSHGTLDPGVHFLAKPFSMRALQDAVAELLSGSEGGSRQGLARLF